MRADRPSDARVVIGISRRTRRKMSNFPTDLLHLCVCARVWLMMLHYDVHVRLQRLKCDSIITSLMEFLKSRLQEPHQHCKLPECNPSFSSRCVHLDFHVLRLHSVKTLNRKDQS